MSNFNFKCNDCNLKFNFESEYSDINEFKKDMGAIRCPKCQKEWGEKHSNIDQVMNASVVSTKTRAQKAKENAERTQQAMVQARMARESNPMETVEVARPKSFNASKYAGNVERVPKKVIDSLKDKATSKDE